ncbi:MAG: hypothetical protein R3F19_20160 [Verrucomicrobiales bacterium]
MPFRFILSAATLALVISTSQAGIVDTLNPASADAFNTIGNLPTWNNNGDKADATFTLAVDFDAKAGGVDEVLWETGGGGTGSSLLYTAGDTLRFITRQGSAGGTTQVDYQLTADQIAAGEIFVSWVFDLGSDEMRLITSHVGGFDHRQTVATVAYTGTDWSGNNAAGFGASTSILGGINPNVSGVGHDFLSGTINTTEGLLFYAGDAYAPSPVPEPMGALALSGAVALVFLQRRRMPG